MILEKTNGENKMQKEIGSNFWEIEIDEKRNNKYWWDAQQYHSEYFVSGRNAILGLCKVLGNEKKKIIMPAYTCSTVVEPFYQENWEIEYYEVNKDLSINIDSLEQKIIAFKPSAILIHSYFGFGFEKVEEEYIKKLKQKGIIIIEDLTQKVFSDNRLLMADYYVFSLRKFLAVPDGGVLVSYKKMNLELAKENSKLVSTAISAFKLKKAYMNGNDLELKEKFRKKYVECNKLLAINRILTKGSIETLDIYRKTNFEPVIKRRINNYNRLWELLKPITCIKLVLGKANDKVVPLYLPLYVKQGKRKELQQFLAIRDIYCPVIWPKYNLIINISKNTEYIYDNILCIPIDQRYGIEEMEKIAKYISEFASKEV